MYSYKADNNNIQEEDFGIVSKFIMFISFGLIRKRYSVNIIMVAVTTMLIFFTILNYLPGEDIANYQLPIDFADISFREIEFLPEDFFVEDFTEEELANFPEDIVKRFQKRN